MIPVLVDYATPSAFDSDRERALLGLTANARRPVRFHARVKERIFPLRLTLRALGEIVWSDETWMTSEEYMWAILDPVISVHPDRVFFEAFSQDQSVYGLVVIDRELFEPEGEVSCGTTNVDFTAWLWAALAEMRSSRATWLRVGPEGFEVRTAGAGGRFEQKVELPEPWVRGFLQLQAAMALPGTRVTCRPVDLLAAIRFLRYTKARTSPRALRYEFEPDQEARIVLEPWEETVRLKGTEHNYDELRTIRTWGRRRLRLIEPVLPFAESVDVYLKGRALPSFYAAKMPGITLMIGLSGWTGNQFTDTGSFDLLAPDDPLDQGLLDGAESKLTAAYHLSTKELADEMGIDRALADGLLVRLCRDAKAIYDLERREFRWRPLFETPIDPARLYPPDPRRVRSRQLVAQGKVAVQRCQVRETRKVKRLRSPEGKAYREVVYRDWEVEGSAGEQPELEIVINDVGKIIFGKCGCEFFRENLLNRGPCEHMIALREASEPDRKDLPTSQPASGPDRPGLGAYAMAEERFADGEDDEDFGDYDEGDSELDNDEPMEDNDA